MRNRLLNFIIIFVLMNVLSQTLWAVYGNGSWWYRKPVTIDGTGTSAGTNYAVKIIVGQSTATGGSHVNVDGHSLTASIFDDLRFTSFADTELSFWRESVTGSAPDQLGTFWVKIPANLTNGTTTIFLYYGNSAASNGSTTAALNVWTETSATDFNAGTTTQVSVNGSGTAAGVILNPSVSLTWTAKSAWNRTSGSAWDSPALGDLDSDGKIDLLLANYQTVGDACQNTGTVSTPTWTSRPAWNTPLPSSSAKLALADLNGDGKLDLLIGDYNGIAYGYENTGTTSNPSWTAKSAWNTPDVGVYASPALADLNGDGKMDLLIGASNGAVYGYENTGTTSTPTWTAKPTWNTSAGTRSSPALADLDGDGDKDLLIGVESGISYGYENTGTSSNPTWTAKSAWNVVDVGDCASPAFADLDNDGDQDLMIGITNWNCFGYENISVTTYSPSGTFVSRSSDTAQTSALVSISWTKSLPAGTTLQFQLASNNDNSTWNFVGPGNNASAYYTTSSGETIGTEHSGKRYFKYKAYLYTTVTSTTPVLSDLSIYVRKYTNPEPQAGSAGSEVVIDTTAPTNTFSVYDGTTADINYVASTTTLSANWTASSDPESGISKYWYAIGTSAGGTQTLDWTDNGAATLVTKTGLSLAENTWYYFSVKAENSWGLQSVAVNSSGQKTDTTAPSTISAVRDGTATDIAYTTSLTQLSANWEISSDIHSGIVKYWYGIGLTAGDTNVLGWTDNGSNLSVTKALSLSQGVTYYFTVKAENGAGLFSTPANANGQQVDTTPPTTISTVNDGTGADAGYTTSTSQLSANWSSSSDNESGVVKYWYGIGLTPGTTNVYPWTNNGTNISVTQGGLSLSGGTTYYFTVKAENGAGLLSATTSNSNGIVVDDSAPDNISAVYDGSVIGTDYVFCSSTSQISANWTASADTQSGVAKYYYRIGTTLGGYEVANWTDNGTATSVTKTGLTLNNGTIYYFSLKAQNGAGLESSVTNSNGQTVDVTIPDTSAVSVKDGSSIDLAYSPSLSQLSANWSGFADAESGIAKYWYAIGTTPGAIDTTTVWIDTGSATAVTKTGLSLTDGVTYYFTVKAENGGGALSAAINSNGQLIDNTVPSNSFMVNDGAGADITYTTSTVSLSANWTASSDAQSGIVKYWYAIGTTAGGSQTVDWTNNGLLTTVTKGGTYVTGTTYYFTVKAENGAGSFSLAVNSNGQTVDTSAPADVSAVYDGAGADITYTPSTSTLSANWLAASDAQSGIGKYWYAIGTTAGGTNTLTWTDNGTALSVTKTGLSLTNGVTYYFSVKAENGAGILSTSAASSNGQITDVSAPAAISTVNDGTGADISYTNSTSQLSANWLATSDSESGIVSYRYAIGTSASEENVLPWTDIGLNTSVTKTGLSLENNTTYYFSVKAVNGAGLLSASARSNGQTVDNTLPATIATVNDGSADDIAYTLSTSQLSANWTASSDTESGIAKYWYAIGTTAGATNVAGWTDNGLSRSVTKTGLSLIDGTTYYFTVKAENAFGIQSVPANSNGQTVDTTPPAAIVTVNDGTGTDVTIANSLTQLSANWTPSSDAQSAIAKYWYAIGTTFGGTDVLTWTNVGLSTAVTKNGLTLTHGATYYFTVKAENGVGLISTPANSDGQCISPVRRIVFLTSPVTVPAGSYSNAACTVQIQDENNTPVNVSEDTVLVLASNAADGLFSQNKPNPLANNELTIFNGANSASFYYYDTVMGQPTITVQHKTLNWWNSASQQENVTTGNINHFLVTVSTSGEAGIARLYRVSAQDVYNNTVSSYTGTVNLGSDGKITFDPASLEFAASDEGIVSAQCLDYYVEQAKIKVEDSGDPNLRGESSQTDWSGVKITPVNLAASTAKQGDSGTAMLKLNIASSSGNGVLKTFKFKKTGSSVLDTDISAVKLYRDDGNGSFESNKDSLLASGVYSLGIVTFSSLTETLAETTKIYYLVYDFSATASSGKTLGVELTDTSFLTITGKTVGKNNFPINSTLVTIETLPRTMSLVLASKIAAKIEQGTTDLVVEKYTAQSNNGTISWAGMGVSLTGSGSDNDISAVKFYRQDSFGQSTLAVDGGIQATLISSGAFVNGARNLSFSSPQTIASSTQNFYLAYDISDQATVGATIGASGVASNFDLGAVDTIDQTYLPYTSELGSITPTVDTVTVTGADLSSLQIKQGSKTRAWSKLNFKTTTHSAMLRSIKIKKKGTLADSQISAIKIYKEDSTSNTGIDIGAGTTAQVKLVSGGSDTFNSAAAVVNLTDGELIETSGKNFYLLLELSEEAAIGNTVGVEVEQSGISVDEPDIVSSSGLPFASKEVQITDNPDKLAITGSDLLGNKSLVQGRETAVLKLGLTVNHDKTAVNKIKLKRLGTCADNDIEKIKIFADANNNKMYDSADRQLNSATAVFNSGITTINFTSAEEVSLTKTPLLFVVLAIKQDAQTSKTAGVEISDNSYFDVSSPDTVDSANFPFTSTLAIIKDVRTPTTPVVTDDGQYTTSDNRLHFKWNATVEEGSIGEILYAIGKTAGGSDVVNWTPSGSDLEVSRIDLYLKNGTTYYFSVKAKNSLGEYWSDTGTSDGISADLVKPLCKELPKISEVTKRGPVNDVVIRLPIAEAGVSGIVKYEIQQKEAKSPRWVTIKVVGQSSLNKAPSNRAFNPNDETSLTYLIENVPPGTYFYRVMAENGAGVDSDWVEMASPVVVGDLPAELLTSVSNYPNPFDSRTTSTKINFTLNQPANVKITIYDLLGLLVKEQNINGSADSNNYLPWDGTDNEGRKVGQGMYLAVIEAEGNDGSKAKVIRKVGVIH